MAIFLEDLSFDFRLALCYCHTSKTRQGHPGAKREKRDMNACEIRFAGNNARHLGFMVLNWSSVNDD